MHYALSYSSLQLGAGKMCGRYSARVLELLERSLTPFALEFPLRTMFIRFVSDDTVHHDGFSFDFIARSDAGELISSLSQA